MNEEEIVLRGDCAAGGGLGGKPFHLFSVYWLFTICNSLRDLWLSWGDSKAYIQMSGHSGCAIGMQRAENAISIKKLNIHSGSSDQGRLVEEVASLLGLKKGNLVDRTFFSGDLWKDVIKDAAIGHCEVQLGKSKYLFWPS